LVVGLPNLPVSHPDTSATHNSRMGKSLIVWRTLSEAYLSVEKSVEECELPGRVWQAALRTILVQQVRRSFCNFNAREP